MNPETLVRKNQFSLEAPHYYNETDRNNHGIQAHDRQGKSCFFPLLSLSIGIVPPEAVINCSSHMEISDLAAEAKHQAKLISGNSYFINRRTSTSVAEPTPYSHTFSTVQNIKLKAVS